MSSGATWAVSPWPADRPLATRSRRSVPDFPRSEADVGEPVTSKPLNRLGIQVAFACTSRNWRVREPASSRSADDPTLRPGPPKLRTTTKVRPPSAPPLHAPDCALSGRSSADSFRSDGRESRLTPRIVDIYHHHISSTASERIRAQAPDRPRSRRCGPTRVCLSTTARVTHVALISIVVAHSDTVFDGCASVAGTMSCGSPNFAERPSPWISCGARSRPGLPTWAASTSTSSPAF